MGRLSFSGPLFATYAIAATLMIVKAVAISWLQSHQPADNALFGC
jgi:hypothetical protein